MKIGELAKRTGLTSSAIRFYESKGLLNSAARQTNGYRDYPLEAVAVLSVSVNAQRTGFSLDEIKRILPEDFTNLQHDKLIAALRYKIASIEAMQVQLAQNKTQLMSLLQLIDAKPTKWRAKTMPPV